MQKIAPRIALVTGASAGIGEATVKRLIRDGWTVYAAARRLDRMEPLRAFGAELIHLDLTDDASIVAAVETIRTATGRLDLLVNNAGYGSYGAARRPRIRYESGGGAKVILFLVRWLPDRWVDGLMWRMSQAARTT